MSKATKKPKPKGTRRLRELGKIASQLWYTPEDYEIVKKAASLCRRPMTQFAIMATLQAARYALDKLRDPIYYNPLKEPVDNGDKT